MSDAPKRGPSTLSSSRYRPGSPARRTSQSGYGHKVSNAGSTTPQGRGRNPAKKKPR
jgi:hypothetical protein